MKIPLIASPSDIRLRIIRNGSDEIVDAPMKPTILVQKDKFSDITGPCIKKIKVPENEEREYTICRFNSLDEILQFRSENKERQRYMLTSNFLEQIYISHPDFMYQYPHNEDMVVMFFDIEIATRGDGFFPKPISNEILCIGYSIWLYKDNGEKVKKVHKIIDCFDDKAERIANVVASDRKIIREFVNAIKEHDPHLIVGFNSNGFDFPYIIDRAKLIHESLNGTGKYNKSMYLKKDEVKIPGRIHFDIYNSNAGVRKDQTLFGIKSRSLKELARFYGVKRTVYQDGEWIERKLDDIELPHEIENLVKLREENPDRLYAYQDDDIYRTEGVGHVYIRNCITLAETLGVPLDAIISMYSSFIPKIFIGRNMMQKNLINTESNFQRYNASNGSIAKLGVKYEGALVGLYKDGFFPQTYKVDFSSYYPSTIQTFNLGPDTTSFVSKEPYTGNYSFSKDSKYNWYRIPDKNFDCDVIVKVRNDIDGLLKNEIAKLRTERNKIKKELKTCKTEVKNTLESQQYAIKVVMNSIYGSLGLQTTIYGDLISAMMVTAMCRLVSAKTMQLLKNQLVECDTDGYIIDKDVDVDDINGKISDFVFKSFNISDNYLLLDKDVLGKAYFYAMKNYVIEENGKHIIHGSSLKASRASRVVDRAIKLAIEHIFNNKPKEEVLAEALDFTNVPLEDFEERVRLSKEPHEYNDPYDYKLLLAKQMELKTGQIGTMGTQFSYVIAKKQLQMAELKPYYREGSKNYTFIKWIDSKDDLDLTYYKNLILKTLDKFDIRELSQTNLFGDDYENELNKKRNKSLDEVPDVRLV